MSALVQYPHITIDEAGVARVGRTRYKVLHLVGEHYHYGWSAEELLRQHPDLHPEEVYSALVYFYDHHDELIAQLKKSSDYGQAPRAKSPLSRDELLRRGKDREPR